SAKINMIANQMDDLFKRLKTAEDGLAQASSRQSANGTAVAEAAIESLKSEMVVLRQEIDAGIGETTSKLANETGALEARISELSGKLETVTAAASRKLDSEQVVARSVAATALRTAYDRGEPFAPLLASVETLLGSQPTIEALRSHAATGVMTNDRLKTEFADLADTVLASVAPKEEGMMARLMANAKSLVKVRPAGPMQGSEPEAVVSRIEADLQSGALTSALAEWENLPEPAKAASADWSKSLQSRIEADQLMVQLSTFLSDAGTQ
ncbi:MAG: mitofilin family membrane protein, partial [Nitratireductor sp.]